MESGVGMVKLEDKVTVDIGVLAEYSGQGECSQIVLKKWDHIEDHKEDLRTWASSRHWHYDYWENHEDDEYDNVLWMINFDRFT